MNSTEDKDLKRVITVTPAEAHEQRRRLDDIDRAMSDTAHVLDLLSRAECMSESEWRAVAKLCSEGVRRIAETDLKDATDAAGELCRRVDACLGVSAGNSMNQKDPS